VAATLLGSLGRRPAAAERVETSDPEAHALHLQGMVLFNRRGPRPLQQAIALFERAAARDPAYARPRAALAMALAVLPAYVPDSIEATLRRAIAAAERAITIDSSISESYTALGYSHLLLGDLWQSDSNFRRALSIDTTATALGWASQLAARLGDFSTANALVTRARELEPASVIAHVWVAQVLEQEGRLEAADSVASQAVGLDSTFGLAWSWRARAQLGLGRSEAAIALLQRRVALLPDDSSQEPHSMLAYAYALAGRFAEARAELDARSGRRVRAIAFRALALDELGDHEGAVKMFADAIARREPWLVLFPHSRVFGKLGRDPRVAAMLDQLKRKP
jgi:tetratricopeptide (TPR) repeat protein